MAENEILDVGDSRNYRRWRKALADANLSPTEVAESLGDDCLLVLRKKLRGKPLYLVLKACALDRKVLQEVVVNCKDRAMAKLVEQAYVITRSNDPLIVARKIAELWIGRLVDRANCHAFKNNHSADSVRHAALERAASARLEACKPEIVSVLVASVRNEPIRRMPGAPKTRPAAEILAATSLLRPENKRRTESTHV